MTTNERADRIAQLVSAYLASGRSDAAAYAAEHSQGDADVQRLLLEAIQLAATPVGGGTVILGDDTPVDPDHGRRIDGRYVIERRLGEGGFGVVYLVRDEVHRGNLRALKTLRAALLADEELVQRFRNEIITLKAVAHRFVPKFHGDGRTEEGDLYYVMDYVDGRRLDDILLQDGPMAPDRIVAVVRQVLEVLDYAHEKGVYHRDLKPANLILVKAGTPDEEVRVLDFGIAKISSTDDEFSELESLHTMQGGAIGTPHYMAPEQVDGRGGIDGKTDLYALGVIVYQMCSGRVPFSGKTSMEIAAARLTQAPPPLDASTPEWLRDLVMRLLQRQKEKRPGTRELRLELDHLSKGQRELKRMTTWIGAGILAIALGVSWLLYRGHSQPQQDQTTTNTNAPVVAPPNPVTSAPVAFLEPADGTRVANPDVSVVIDARGRDSVFIADREVKVGSDGIARTTLRVAADQTARITVRDAAGTELGARSIYVDTRPPALTVNVPDGVLAKGAEWWTAQSSLLVRGTVTDGADGQLPAKPITFGSNEPQAVDAAGGFDLPVTLTGGRQELLVRASDSVGLSTSVVRGLSLDAAAPSIEFSTSSEATELDRLRLQGRVTDMLSKTAKLVRAAGSDDLALDTNGGFSVEVALQPGLNEFVVEAQDELANRASAIFRVERRRAVVGIANVTPESGRVFAAFDARATISASTNQRASRVEVSRNGATLDLPLRPRADGFELELPLQFGANVFRLVPYGDDGVAGRPFDLSYVRTQPALPAGCVLGDDVQLDAQGRPKLVLHERSGLVLVLVSGDVAQAPFYIAQHEFTIGAARRARPSFYESPERATEIWDRVPKSTADAHPAILVTFDEAKELCRDLGLRLCTTAEWEAASGARDGRTYPWGKDWIAGACNADDPADSFRYTAPVMSFASDVSPHGAFDMAGNVSEWCTADDKPALRGGNWYSSPETCKLLHVRNPPAKRSDFVGFRPALDAPALPR